ncbi:MAG: hypothetical protein L3J93_01960 [Thermoplasmata archaeon]|nr:hypothetical protein [Thermoplasmata archaeon]
MASIDLATWATILGTWILVVGTLVFAYWQLRQAQRLHSSTTLLDLRERFYSPRMRQARRDLSTWLLKETRGEEPEDWEVGIFFELMGALTRTKVLEKRMVWSAFATWITAYHYCMTHPVDLLAKWRGESNDPLIFAEFEWLATTMLDMDRRLAPGAHDPRTSASDAQYVLESESHLRLPPEPLDTRA